MQLERERASYEDEKSPVPLTLVQKLKIVADQIRLDHRLDPPEEVPNTEPVAELTADDPLDTIRLSNTDAA